MVSARVLQLWLLACLASAVPARGESYGHLMTAPHPLVLEVGTNFTATCMINTAEVTADDLYWNLSGINVSKEQYTKIDRSTLNVTIPITGEGGQWLLCRCKEQSPYVTLNRGKFEHGIYLRKAYPPRKPENLTCVALQEHKQISSTISCFWKPVGRQTPQSPTSYTLHVVSPPEPAKNISTLENHAQVLLSIFPSHMQMEVWVEASNALGKIESEHLRVNSVFFVKTNPPADLEVISEKNFPTSLLISWKTPISRVYLELTYQIRFCPEGSQSWTYVPSVDIATDMQSFRLQNLRPDTVYVTQVSCKSKEKDHGYWSDWSTNATGRTPEDRPKSKPDLWRKIAEGDSRNYRNVTIICKRPVLSNGEIIRFSIRDQKDKFRNGSWEWESIEVKSEEKVTELKSIHLADNKLFKVLVTASNSVGTSPEASLRIPEKAHEHPLVEDLKVEARGRQLWLEWKPPNSKAVVSEYVVEWGTGEELIDWQRENRHTNRTAIKDDLEDFVCYNVSVYPIYSGWVGKPARIEAYLTEGEPLDGPTIQLVGKQGRNDAKLMWNEIPLHRRRGFITNYTISYRSERSVLQNIIVPANTTTYTLTSLLGNTKYDTWITASTVKGSTKGFSHSFTTSKYGDGQIEVIVVGVSLGFLFVFILTTLLCFYKKDMIKENFWPQIPNPGESTIGNWSPDYPLKAETPKENCLSGISVLDVDVCDGKSVFEEDKASLPLKKDKYLSEEHSSGIGGSSCMSSPRQSVSDSDEGGDMVDTTASTVQYSSVVASSGYKGQTPSSQPQQAIFSRSESTQPLLDSEENPDMLQEGSRQSRRFPRQPCFTDSAEGLVLEPLDFCPLEEDSEQTTPTDDQAAEWLPAAAASSYMPQLGGYRPQ